MTSKFSNVLNFFYEVGILRHAKRAYTTKVLVPTESIADHSHRAVVIAYVLAEIVGANPEKAALMAAFHDLPEARTGDMDWVQKQYVEVDEDKAIEAQLSPLGDLANGIRNILNEYHARETLESKVAKDADNIEYNLSLKELAHAGNKEAQIRLDDNSHQKDKLYTPEAKELIGELFQSNPNEWIRQDIKETLKRYAVK